MFWGLEDLIHLFGMNLGASGHLLLFLPFSLKCLSGKRINNTFYELITGTIIPSGCRERCADAVGYTVANGGGLG